MKPCLSTYHHSELDIQQPFDVAVVIPTILRPTLADALRSVFAQDIKGRVQILIGIDQATNNRFDWDKIAEECPKNMALSLFWPGYSTNKLNGGMHNALGGGSLRSLLSFLANAKYIAYLDDDNWFSPNHLSSLYKAIKGKKWAFSQRWFVSQETRSPICQDSWESVGPDKGVFASNFNGFVDTNCLMINMAACRPLLSQWCIPHLSDKKGRGADRSFFSELRKLSPYGKIKHTTVSYIINPHDGNHKERLNYIKKHNIQTGTEACNGWLPAPKTITMTDGKLSKSGFFKAIGDHSKPFDIAVIIPTIGRETLKTALRSVMQQDFKGRVQILVGMDKSLGVPDILQRLNIKLPPHMGLILLDPGYSTSKRHGGIHPAHDGGAMRTILSYLAHAPLLAYLDDDNSWQPSHLSSLNKSLNSHHYAHSLRCFIHPDRGTPICTDQWESIGPNKGYYSYKFNGFVDPNCLLINIQKCLDLLPIWSTPLAKDKEAMSADRMVFNFLAKQGTGKSTNQATVNYFLSTKDPMHFTRAIYLGHHWINADFAAYKKRLKLAPFSFVKGVESPQKEYK